MKAVDITDRVAWLWDYFNKMLDKRLDRISALSGVERERLSPINPADWIERNKYQIIRGYEYRKIADWIEKTKEDGIYLISPLDDVEKTANQISYKEHNVAGKIRASKCGVIPLHEQQVNDFLLHNHRQGKMPPSNGDPVSFGLVYDGQLMAVMNYSKQKNAIRGASKADKHELVRLAIAHGFCVNGGASKLQKHCEEALRALGQTEIFSYSNATINNGGVYRQLGFVSNGVEQGRVFVIMHDNRIKSLASLCSSEGAKLEDLAKCGNISFRLGGNKLWVKNICEEA